MNSGWAARAAMPIANLQVQALRCAMTVTWSRTSAPG